MKWMTVALLTALSTPADALSICSMAEQQAIQSPDCVRWHFVCKYRPGTGTPPAGVDRATFDKMVATAIFLSAERACEIFSYQEAFAALRAHAQ